MDTVFDLLDRFEQLDPQAVINEAVDAAAPFYASINREQLMQGYGSDGKHLRRYRSPAYAGMKHEMNPAPGYGNPDLRLTGAWQEGIQTDRKGDLLDTHSKDGKDSMLQAEYPNALGLNDDSANEWVDLDLTPAFYDRMEYLTGLDMK